jgi:hypothetical protein
MKDFIPDILPIIIMIEMFLSSIILAWGHRWGSALYWFSAGMISIAVIFMIRRYG